MNVKKFLKKIRKKRYKEFKLPSTEELYENQITEIVIKPQWWDIENDVLKFIELLCEGYLWECKFGTAFVAKHYEYADVERILHRIQSLKHREKEGRWVPNDSEEIQLILVDWARLVPRMWD